jgi:uncharacterized membrane protein YbhN (UPF0104 family)
MATNQSKKIFIIRIVFGLLIISAGLGWLLQSQKAAAQKVLLVLPRFSIPCLLVCLILDCLQIFFMAVRFWWLYPKGQRAYLSRVFSAMSIGQTMNAFLPARAGDFYKVATLTPKPAKPDFSILTLTGIMASDKLVDLVSFLVLIFAFGSYRQNLKSINFGGPQTLGWSLVGIAIFGLLWQFLLKKKFGQLAKWALQFIKGFKSLLAPRQLFTALSFAILVWLCEALVMKQLSFYQSYPISLTQAFFVLTVLNIAIALPISVANIGPFEASIVFGFTQLGMPLESALAIATVHHGLQVLAYILCGGIGWLLNRFYQPQTQVAL